MTTTACGAVRTRACSGLLLGIAVDVAAVAVAANVALVEEPSRSGWRVVRGEQVQPVF